MRALVNVCKHMLIKEVDIVLLMKRKPWSFLAPLPFRYREEMDGCT